MVLLWYYNGNIMVLLWYYHRVYLEGTGGGIGELYEEERT